MKETSEGTGGSAVPRVRVPVARTGLALLLGAGLVLGLYTTGQVLVKKWLACAVPLLPVCVLVVLFWRARGRPAGWLLRRHLPELVLVGALFLFLFSSVVRHPWFYFLQWAPDPDRPYTAGMARFVVWTALATPLFLRPLRRVWVLVLLVLLGAQFLCVRDFLAMAQGKVLYRTDHPSFMFRLWEFAHTFPQLVNYNPYWNAGTLHYVGVTSGAHGPGFLLWPWLRLFPVHEVYNAGLLALFVFFVPWTAVASVRALGGDRTAALAGGVLALGVSQHFFLWMLHFGTIGAALSSAMTLPVVALGFRVVWRRRTDPATGVALVLASFLLLLWPAAALAGVAVGAGALASCTRWRRRTVGFLAVCAVVVAALYARRLAVIAGVGSGVVGHVMQDGTPGGAGAFAWLTPAAARAGLLRLAAHLQEFHPLLLFLGLGGACAARDRSLRRWFVPVFVVLLLVTGWSREWKPRSQLDRMAIPLAFAAVAPAAVFAGRLLRARDPRLAPVRAGLFVLLALGGYGTSLIYRNRGLARYTTLPPPVEELVGWLREHVPEGGRVCFAGPCLHAYGRGNVAYLPVLVGREMMADDYYGFPLGTIEYNYPPPAFRYPAAALMRFARAYNVTHLLTYKENWKTFLRAHPECFREELSIFSINLEIAVFTVLRDPAVFLEGGGTARADFNRIELTFDDPSREAAIAYNWVEGLRADRGVELFPYRFEEGITLIGARPHGAPSCTVTFRPPRRAAGGE